MSMSKENFSKLEFSSIIKNTTSDTFIYGLGTLLNSGAVIILLPLYLSVLSAEEYGVLNLARITPILLIVFITMNLPGSVIRFYYDWQEQKIERQAIYTLTLFLTIVMIITTIIVLKYGDVIFSKIFKLVEFDPYIKYAVLAEIATIPVLLSIKLMRIKGEAWIYMVFSVISISLILMFSYYFVFSIHEGVIGALKAYMYANTIMLFFGYVYLNQNSIYKINIGALRECIKYSAPLIPGSLITTSLSIADRFLLDKFISSSELGIYAVARTISRIVTMFAGLMQMAFFPIIMRIFIQRKNSKYEITKLCEYFTYILFFITTIMLLASPSILGYIGGEEYIASLEYLPLLLVLSLIQALYIIPVAQIGIAKVNINELYSSLIEVFILILIVVFLIESFGVNGLISALISSSIISFVFLTIKGQKYYQLDWALFIKISMLSTLMLMLALGLDFFNRLFM